MMICLTIQKNIVEACAKETTKAIIEDTCMVIILEY